jgi:hypothetical protein
MKNKSNINIIIDAAMFVLIAAVGGIGFLMKYRLVRGSLRRELFGTDVDQFLWGWERHQWGALHLALGFILFGLLVLHIVLHWKQIKTMVIKLIPLKTVRIVLSTVFMIVTAVMLFFAFIINIQTVKIKEGEGEHWGGGNRQGRQRYEAAGNIMSDEHAVIQTETEPENQEEHEAQHDLQSNDITVNGTMTLAEVERIYDIPADSVKAALKIPGRISDRERLGRLRRHYGFHMSEIERIIEVYRKRH